jgi:sulfide:quinone oxidoreductase
MQIQQIDERLSISAQIEPRDLAELAERGVKLIICNRPDGEQENQIDHKSIAKAAKKNGIGFEFIPVAGRNIPHKELFEFINCLEKNTEKVHAYCRTGTRCSIFWGLSLARKMPVEQVLTLAASRGLDLSQVKDQLLAIHAQSHTT